MEIAKICEALVPPSLLRSEVEKVLARIKHGALLIKHPDGSELRCGDLSSPLVLEIKDDRFYLHCILFGDVGFGEAYTEGWWTTPDLMETLKLLIDNAQELGGMSGTDKTAGNLLKLVNKGTQLLRANTLAGSRKNIEEHYDLSNEFYSLWLDPTMTYSSALWNKNGMTLEQAQRAKWKELAESLELKETDELLEIGTGWGGFACFAAKEYGCKVTTFTISKEQHRYAQELFKREGVSDRITLHLQDYRKIEGTFDKIVSIEMMEAIGHDFLPVFFRVIQKKLRPQGLMSFQVITTPDSRYHEYRKSVDWIQKHIFPGGLLPSVGHLHEVINKMTDMHLLKFLDMGTHYAKTLNEWDKNFQRVKPQVTALGFDARFQRKWHYYLKYCEAAFITRNISVVQMTLTRPNNRKLVNAAL